MYLLVGNYTLKPGTRSRLLEALKERDLENRFRKEPGNVEYTYLIPSNEPDVLRLIEVWTDKASFEAHKTCAAALEWGKLSAEYVAARNNHKYQAEED